MKEIYKLDKLRYSSNGYVTLTVRALPDDMDKVLNFIAHEMVIKNDSEARSC
jgi:hypothetical protein